ncbi:MAG: hypothetical protein RJB38_1220 [Pseudomonadota bacterium]|jgi:hypothetical protein
MKRGLKMSRIFTQELLGSMLITLALSGCGIQEVTDSERVYPLDGVKLLRAGIDSPTDPSTLSQPEYRLDTDSRLLLRLESLSQYNNTIRTTDGYSVQLIVTTKAETDAERDHARSHLQLCALTKNWMMLATWKRGHPFDSSGKWSKPGGDYDPDQCFSASITTQGSLSFNVTPWFVMEVRGRGKNFGFVLLTSAPVTIGGDASGADAPRFEWTTSTSIIHPRTP